MNACLLIATLVSRRVTDAAVIAYCTAGWNIFPVIQTSTILGFTKQP